MTTSKRIYNKLRDLVDFLDTLLDKAFVILEF